MKKVLFYHITHYSNLPSIIKNSGLVAKNYLDNLDLEYKCIAHESIQDKRCNVVVPLSPGGNLHDYVPFYFCRHSPMLFTIHKGNVAGYEQGQEEVIYLVSDTDQVISHELDFVFTDGHAIMFYTQYFKNINDLSKLPWHYINSRYWFDNAEHNDRKRQKQSEFLIHKKVPWSIVESIVVFNQRIADIVEHLISGAAHKPLIHVKRDWYY